MTIGPHQNFLEVMLAGPLIDRRYAIVYDFFEGFEVDLTNQRHVSEIKKALLRVRELDACLFLIGGVRVNWKGEAMISEPGTLIDNCERVDVENGPELRHLNFQ